MTNRTLLPRYGSFIDPTTGDVTRVFYQYLSDIDKRADAVNNLPAGTPTNDEIKAKVNELLESLRTAGILKA